MTVRIDLVLKAWAVDKNVFTEDLANAYKQQTCSDVEATKAGTSTVYSTQSAFGFKFGGQIGASANSAADDES